MTTLIVVAIVMYMVVALSVPLFIGILAALDYTVREVMCWPVYPIAFLLGLTPIWGQITSLLLGLAAAVEIHKRMKEGADVCGD